MRINARLQPVTETDRLFHDDKLMVNVSLTYPKVEGRLPVSSARAFDSYNRTRAQRLMRRARTELYRAAVEQYEYAKERGFPFNAYELMQVYTETYNKSPLISLYSDVYEYTGGAHGITVRRGQTWDLERGCMLRMANLFRPGYNFRRILLTEILRQADINQRANAVYFDDYRQLIVRHFDPANFYLTPRGVAVFYPLYSIAPYAAGIQVFVVPYALFGRSFDPHC